MKPGRLLHKLRSMPPGEIARRVREKARDRIETHLRRWIGYRRPTFAVHPPAWLEAGLSDGLPALPAPVSAKALEACRYLSGQALAHRFDLLGSGWAEVKASGPGTPINEANRAEAARLRSLIDPRYRPMEWHTDFKSGFRWASDSWSPDLAYGSTPGADVKVPWELSRMQHLPQLAHAYAASRAGAPGFNGPEGYLAEYRNQILDFISANPPGFGVNWICTMDVGIRTANWLMARDLFRAYGAPSDPAFEAVLTRSIYEHGRHIIRNLEWGPGLRGNHYFADIAGLAAAACFLPSSPESDAWLAFSVRELIGETRIQFLPDGSNFEASTCYHRLSAEMLAYATALVLAQPSGRLESLLQAPGAHRPFFPRFFRYAPLEGHAYPGWGRLPFPPWYFERMERAAEFVMDITRPDGRMPQIGDNDSGRFLKLYPALAAAASAATAAAEPASPGTEDFLDHRHLTAAMNGFFGREDFTAFAGSDLPQCETALVSALLRGRRFPSYRKDRFSGGGGEIASYPDFGVFIYRRDEAYLAFRCGPIGQLDMGGHAHNDQLSFELAVKGVPFLEDRGTFLYTADWEARNRFRSTAWHNTLLVEGQEQDPWENTRAGLFMLQSKSRACILDAGPAHIEGEHTGFGAPHRRRLRLEGSRLEGTDWCDRAGTRSVRFHFNPEAALSPSPDDLGVEAERDGVKIRLRGEGGTWSLESSQTSPAYGVVRKAQVAILSPSGLSPIKWYIEWSL